MSFTQPSHADAAKGPGHDPDPHSRTQSGASPSARSASEPTTGAGGTVVGAQAPAQVPPFGLHHPPPPPPPPPAHLLGSGGSHGHPLAPPPPPPPTHYPSAPHYAHHSTGPYSSQHSMYPYMSTGPAGAHPSPYPPYHQSYHTPVLGTNQYGHSTRDRWDQSNHRGGRGQQGSRRGHNEGRDRQSGGRHQHPGRQQQSQSDGRLYFKATMLQDPWISSGMITAEEASQADELFRRRCQVVAKAYPWLVRESNTSVRSSMGSGSKEVELASGSGGTETETHEDSSLMAGLFASLPPARTSVDSVPPENQSQGSSRSTSAMTVDALSETGSTSKSKFASLLSALPKPKNPGQVVQSSLGDNTPAITLSSSAAASAATQISKSTPRSSEAIGNIVKKADIDLYSLMNQDE